MQVGGEGRFEVRGRQGDQFGGLGVATASVVALEFGGEGCAGDAQAECGFQGGQGFVVGRCASYVDCGSGGVGGDYAVDQFQFGLVDVVTMHDQAAGS